MCKRRKKPLQLNRADTKFLFYRKSGHKINSGHKIACIYLILLKFDFVYISKVSRSVPAKSKKKSVYSFWHRIYLTIQIYQSYGYEWWSWWSVHTHIWKISKCRHVFTKFRIACMWMSGMEYINLVFFCVSSKYTCGVHVHMVCDAYYARINWNSRFSLIMIGLLSCNWITGFVVVAAATTDVAFDIAATASACVSKRFIPPNRIQSKLI